MRTRTLVACLLVAGACSEASAPAASESFDDCAGLFGAPGQNTGLGEDQCRAYCERSDGTRVDAPTISAASVQQLAALVLENPPEPLTLDAYAEAAAPEVGSAVVCGVLAGSEAGRYRLQAYATLSALREAGAILTHRGRCGLCSPLSDFAVYASNPDLATPVRECGLMGLGGDAEAVRSCLNELGFSDGCAEIWTQNTLHTSEVCLDACFAALGEPYHDAEGNPNACISCDEQMSGPVFKYYAGRTRRNTGLASALCRPWSEVTFIEHDYAALF